MGKHTILCCLLVSTLSLSSQHTVTKRWDARFGGYSPDYLSAICQTSDGGFVLAGVSASGANGDKTQPNWDTTGQTDDGWLVKVDASGHYQWDRRFGGTGGDGFISVAATPDGGCIAGGSSASGISGDKSQPCWGADDMWVVKVDAHGTKQWDRRYGGTGDDYLMRIRCTADGGYIMSGLSRSGISGDKTEPNWDRGNFYADYWMVKIDSFGTKQWDKRFGTSADEGSRDVIQTPDGGYLIGGNCYVDSLDGDKTQPNWAHNTSNYWIVKTDSLGRKLWDHVYGGRQSEIYGNAVNTTDGNILLGGSSLDGISGDKTTANPGFWIVKIDQSGTKLGDWSYCTILSGAQYVSMTNTSDGGYLLTGSLDKIWTIKIDSLMQRVWDHSAVTIISGYSDYSAGALDAGNGCYVVATWTWAGVGGDKTQPNWDSTCDYWIVEYCDSGLTGIAEEHINDISLSVYPVPSSGELTIHIRREGLSEASFTLSDPTGRTLYESHDDHLASSYTKILDIHLLPPGTYLLDMYIDSHHISRSITRE